MLNIDNSKEHQSVLLYEAVQALNVNSNGIYIDGTFGGGGHSKVILSKLGKQGRLIAMDRDHQSIKIGKMIAKQDSRFCIFHDSFSKMKKYVQCIGYVGKINGILLDLGLSSYQLNDVSRGFSFLNNGFLDMRMDIRTGKTAIEWLSHAKKKEIDWVLKVFGEEKFSKRIAESIVRTRKRRPIITSHELSRLICEVVPYYHRKGISYKHPATRSFLAIRMYINKELNEIDQVLQDSLEILSPKGRLIIISFNSLEDRLVKNFIHRHSSVIVCPRKLPLRWDQIVTKYKDTVKLKNMGKLVPSVQEIQNNIRARSGILRYAEKLIG